MQPLLTELAMNAKPVQITAPFDDNEGNKGREERSGEVPSVRKGRD